MQACRNRRPLATRPPLRSSPAGLLVRLRPLVVRIIARDAAEERQLEPLAALVAHVLEHALRREAGAA